MDVDKHDHDAASRRGQVQPRRVVYLQPGAASAKTRAQQLAGVKSSLTLETMRDG